ncbi:MAG: hypothetical protein K2J67_12865 [Lachnospiraceae bacterium]|nr:hypothetical protein [Lachnospiraceae bacterium]
MFRKKRQKESSLHLTDKHHPPLAIAATVLALVSVGLFGAVCISAGESDGQAGLVAGLLGMVCLLIAAVGFVMSWISLHQDDIRPLFPTIASVSNGLLVIFYMALYIWGAVI